MSDSRSETKLEELKPAMSRLLVCVIGVVWLTLATLTLGSSGPENIQFLDDQAFLMGTAQAVRRGELLLSGLPSHLGARHPGPYYVYLQAALSWLGGGDPVAVSRLFSVLKLLTPLLLVMALVRTLDSQVNGYVAGLFSALVGLSGYTLVVMRMDWVNYFIVPLSALFILAVVRVLAYGVSALPFLLVASTLLIQPHLSPLPMLGAAWFVVIMYIVWTARDRSKQSTTTVSERIVCLVATAILWLPPLVYEFQYGHNLWSIISNNLGKRPQGVELSELPGVLFGTLTEMVVGGSQVLSPLVLATLGFVCLFLVVRIVRVGPPARRMGALVVIVQSLMMVLAVSQVKPPVHNYYLISMYGPLLFLWGLLAQEACSIVIGYVSKRDSHLITVGVAVLLLVIFAYSRGGALIGLRDASREAVTEPYFTLQHSRDVGQIIARDAGDTAHVKVIAQGAARLTTNAYYYGMTPVLRREYMYAPRMIELPVIQSALPEYTRGYLIECDASEAPHEPTLGRKHSRDWRVGERVDLSSCHSCTRCAMWRMSPLRTE